MQQNTTTSLQQEMLRQRLPLVVGLLMIASFGMIVRMILFQAPQSPEVATYVQRIRDAQYGQITQQTAARGIIYDRNGQPMAVNTLLYRIGISPNLVSDPQATIENLSAILNRDPLEISALVNSKAPYELLASRVTPDVWRRIDQLDYISIRPETIPVRYYPQGKMASQVIGFVGGGAENLQGYLGVEGYYHDQLAGRTRRQEVSNIPFDVPTDEDRLDRGADLVLTLDRDIQFIAEAELQLAIDQYSASGGTIIVMNPRTGDILAMVSHDAYDPNDIAGVKDSRTLRNPAISDIYEPGSVFKVLTVAAALEKGYITPSWTYTDNGLITVGGHDIRNWDRAAHGVVDVQQLLIDSLNVGAATIALEMGKDDFYSMLTNFGIGRATGVDMQGETRGILRIPNVDPDWSESDLGANSYGQGVSVTPLQMLTAVNAIANGGLMMQPRIVSQIVRGDRIINLEPLTRRVLSKSTADAVTQMMVGVVEAGLDDQARLPGYTIAGKTGTAEIPTVLNQYEQGTSIVTFVGFLPADDPQLSILIKLDRPNGYWASQVAAPVFRHLAEKLVLAMEIPTDDVRAALAAQGGIVSAIDR